MKPIRMKEWWLSMVTGNRKRKSFIRPPKKKKSKQHLIKIPESEIHLQASKQVKQNEEKRFFF